MRNYFTFGNVKSSDYGVTISGVKKLVIPERDYESHQVPGRLGDVLTNGNSLKNIVIEYPCYIAPPYGGYATLEEAYNAFRNALLSTNAYAKLTDTYDMTHYFMAAYTGGVDADVYGYYDSASFKIEFVCKPQKFFNSRTTHTLTAGTPTTITTNSKRGYPIFTLTGTGSFDVIVGGTTEETVTVTNSFANGIVIDCEKKVCYDADNSSASGNLFARFSNYQFPEINKYGKPISSSVVISPTGLNGTVEVVWYEL